MCMLFERGDRKLFPRFKQKLCYASLFSQDLMFFLAHLAKAKVSFWHPTSGVSSVNFSHFNLLL